MLGNVQRFTHCLCPDAVRVLVDQLHQLGGTLGQPLGGPGLLGGLCRCSQAAAVECPAALGHGYGVLRFWHVPAGDSECAGVTVALSVQVDREVRCTVEAISSRGGVHPVLGCHFPHVVHHQECSAGVG